MSSTRQRPRVTILYEDRRGPTKGFGLHDLVVASTCDILAARGSTLARYVLEQRIEAVPKGPNNRVLHAIKHDSELIHSGYTAIVAWLDDDAIHRPLKLPGGQSRATLLDGIRRLAPTSLGHGALQIFLTPGNLEALLVRMDRAQPGVFPRPLLEQALAKDLSARDLCFREAAKSKHAAWRAAIRSDDPSLDGMFRYLACLASYEPWPPW